ncbi:MAG TPA: hypothetical protein VEJ23_08575 [Solirubrobacteraceae bacterium]|nr:hypothetical protein [Solirubrobacteraceae bacterium]
MSAHARPEHAPGRARAAVLGGSFGGVARGRSGRPSPGRRAAAAALTVAVAVAVAACTSANTKPGLTRAQFIARADTICRAEQARLRRVAAAEHATLGELASDARLIRHAVAIHEAANARLEALPEPPADVTPIARWLAARTVATTLEFDAEQALVKRLPGAARVQAERVRRSALAQGLARGYGLSVCGRVQ